ncbi:uncharacterized protein LOC144644296 [Oculina patagonica]
MHSQEFGNDDAHSSDPLAVVAIIPEKVQHDAREQIVIAFNHRLHVKGRGQFVVDFEGTAGAVQVSARQLNSSTLILEAPKYPVASVVTASVYHGIHRRLLGQHRFEFLSRHDTFYRLLYEALDPVKFMCESLQISPAEVEGLDTALAETLRQNAPEGFDLLGVHKNVPGDSNAEHPTLLHFASQFGLSKLISNLLHYPGAQEACKIRNYHGQWPYNIAENYGFPELADRLRAFRDQGDNDQIYIDMGQEDETSYYVKMQKDDGSYYYVPMNGEGHELYVDMKGKRYINLDKQEEEECYLMKKQNEDGSYYYVPMKGGASGHDGKLYEDVKEKRAYRQAPKPPESDQDTSEGLIYENLNKASDHQDGELYETMEGNTEGQDNPEELYMDMDPEKGDSSELYIDMGAEKGEDPSEFYMDMAAERGEDPSEFYMDMDPGQMTKDYVGYDKPKSNLPVHPDPAFYRSASSAAAIRAKQIEMERKTKSLPPPRGGNLSQLDIQSAFQQSVADGKLTQEEVAELMTKMGISSETAPSIRRRQGSTSSKSSTSTTSSSGSSGVSSGHEYTRQQEPDHEAFEEEEEIHGTLTDLFPDLKQKAKDISAKAESLDVPPPVPQPDYNKGSPGLKKRHPRSYTAPVKQEDLPAGVSTSTPPPVIRRRSEPQSTGLGIQPKISFKKNPPEPLPTRPPAPIPEPDVPRPLKSPPPPTAPRRPMQSPPFDSSRPSMGIPVFPDTPPPQTPQRAPRPAPRSSQK